MNVQILFYSVVSWVVFGCVVPVHGVGEALEQVGKKLLPAAVSPAQGIFTSLLEEKKAKRLELEQELTALKEKEKSFHDSMTERIELLKGKIDQVKEQLRYTPHNEFLEKKLTLLSEHYRFPKEQKKIYEKLLSDSEKTVKLIDMYLADPYSKNYEKDLGLEERDVFTLEQFQDITNRIYEQEKRLAQLNEQKKNVQSELDSRKQALASLQDARKKKTEEHPEFFELDGRQQEDLAEITSKLEYDRKIFYDWRIRESEQRKELLKMEIFLAETHLEKLRQALKFIKSRIKVSDAAIAFARDELVKHRQLFFDAQEAYDQRIEIAVLRQRELEKTLLALAEQKGITLGADLDDWGGEPNLSVQGFLDFFEVATVNTSILLLQRQREFLEAQRVLGDRQLKNEALYLDIKTTFQKVLTHRLTVEMLEQEKKIYELPKSRCKADQISFHSQQSDAQAHLERQKAALVNLNNKRQLLRTQRVLFKQRMQEYTHCLELLNDAEIKVKRQIDLISRLIGIYDDTIRVTEKTLHDINFILTELETEVTWGRPSHAISWEGIKNVRPDIVQFMNDVKDYVVSIKPSLVIRAVINVFQYPLDCLLWLVACFLLVCCLWIFRYVLTLFIPFLLRVNKSQPWLRVATFLVAFVAQFVIRYFVPLVVWVGVYTVLQVYADHMLYAHILFYLGSIPYFLYWSYQFCQHLVGFNMQHDYIFLSAQLQESFIGALATLLYVSVTVLLFREAFLLASYHDSEVPAVLLAANVIVLQIALIFLLAQVIEQISVVIPATNERWVWLRLAIDRYYYLILIVLTAVMIMSNPSVGFGNLVLFVLYRFVLSGLLIIGLMIVHRLLKHASSHLFFYSEHTLVRERFAHGKTWYGVFVILIFLGFLGFGVILTAKIWGWPAQIAAINQWSDILDWLRTPIMFEKTADVPISIFSLIQVIAFVLGGLVTAYIINNFVLERIFDVLLIDAGAQNAISSITRYVILAMAAIFGFQAVGRGDLVMWVLGALALGIGWVVKDPVGDFISYFIILVQRPIKIGDYIRLDDATMGVVRRITPRSVIIRRKNSTMIVVPNSTIINKPLVNWNYQRGFIAFDDIIVVVSYKEDPQAVKSILERVLEENSFVLKSPRPIVRLDEFYEYGFKFMARGFISSNYTLDQWDIASDIRLKIVSELRVQGIYLAMPTRVMLDAQHVGQFMQQAPSSTSDQGLTNN